ncbi:MAG TPA: hypothetical protein PKK61_11285 [Defluviitaleaceae bacterium]|nr:hypothetical protein [Defluviitaleaceae bacterium]
MDLNYYKAIQGTLGMSSKKEFEIAKMRQFISKHFKDTSAFEEEVEFNNCRKQKLLVMKNKNNPDIKKILAYPNESFKIGEVLKCYGEYWIVTSLDVNQQIYTIGTITLCPYILKWQNNSGKIITYHYYTDGTSSKIEENESFDTSASSKKIILPLDTNTREFYIDKRFMGEVFNDIPQCWKITDLNAESKRGLLVVSLEKDEFNPNRDNKELGICDYIDKTNKDNKLYIDFQGNSDIRVGSIPKEFLAIVKDDYGNTVKLNNYMWSFESDNIPTEFVTFTYEEDRAYLSVKNDVSVLGQKIKIKVSVDNLSAEIILQVKGVI